MGQRRNHMKISNLTDRNLTYQKDVIQLKFYLEPYTFILENRKAKKKKNKQTLI